MTAKKPNPSSLKEVCHNIIQRLSTAYPISEAQWMMRIIFEHLKGWTRVDLTIRADEVLSDFIISKINTIIERLLRHEPLQYIIGEARFFGLNLHVTPAVLIPRPETEELVDLIINKSSNRHDLSIMDICTGSGCIAIALARNLPFSSVSAIDISKEALVIARENATSTHTKIDFIHADALNLPSPPHHCLDIIVSNPPYIADHERTAMEPNVLEHEPHLALFVPDSDPLRFYRAISMYAIEALRPEGKLYFEINPLFATELSEMLNNHGWNDIEIILDSHKKQRFASATAPKK